MSEIEAKGTAFTSIPIIDIAPLFSDDEAGKRKVAAEMAEAAANVGFLYVKGHNIPREMIDRLEARAAEFFALPEERKMAHYIGKSRAHRGYVPTGEEGFYDGTNPAKMDKKEAFDLSVELPEDDPDHVTGYRMLGPNQWPDELPEMRRDVYAYYEAAMALGRTLFGGFARALGLPENHFERWLTKPPSQLRLVHYPSDPARAVAEWGISAHTDYECFTILHVTAPGLQVMNAKGDWIEAPPVEGAFVINIGAGRTLLLPALLRARLRHADRTAAAIRRRREALSALRRGRPSRHPDHAHVQISQGTRRRRQTGTAGKRRPRDGLRPPRERAGLDRQRDAGKRLEE